MNTDFSEYIAYIVLIAVLFLGLAAFIAVKLMRPKRAAGKPGIIDSGNISVFFDRSENVVIIPYIKDKFGMGRATVNVEFLAKPYTPEKLGFEVRQAMLACRGSTACQDSELMKRLGYWGWKEFSEGRRNISVHYQEGRGLVFCTTIRKSDGAYQFNHPSYGRVTGNDLPDMELGKTLQSLLQYCRA